MSEVIERGATRIALRVSRDRNRRLLADLLTNHDIVDITDTVPDDTDLCIIDDRGVSQADSVLGEWKQAQQPTYAPVLLLSESSGTDPWDQYAGLLGDRIDAIQPIPAPRTAIRARVEALLETRQYSTELASERQLVNQIFATSPIAKTVLDTDGNIVRANQRAEAVLGLSESELTGRAYDSPDWRIIDENGDPIPSEELPFSRVMASGEPIYGYEHGIVRPDGDRVWLSVNMGPIENENGDIEYLVSAIDDVTERKRLERELRESEELHRTTLSNITDTVFITDDDGQFTYVCPNVHFIFGYSADDVREMGSAAALLGEDPAREGVADDGVENIEWNVTDADGQEHTVLVTVTPVSIQGGTRLYSVRDVTELVESERSLALEQERLETVVSNAPLILLAVDSDGTIMLSKGRQLDQLGLEPGEVNGESILSVFEDSPEIRESAERLLDGEAFSTEIRIQNRVFRSWNQPIGEDGDLDHAIIVAQDITEYKRQEERFRAFVEGSSDIITVLDSDGLVEYASPSVERILGYEPQEMVGENAFELIHPEDRGAVAAAFSALSDEAEGTTFTERYRTRHADGTWRWTESRTTKQASMTQGRFVVNTRDITEQVEAERDLRRTEESRSLALEASQAGVWEWELETDEVIWHEATEALFGLEPGTFEGTYEAFADRIHPEDLPRVEGAIEQSIEQNEPFQTTFRIIRDDGAERWIEGRGRIVSDDSGTPERLLGVDVDITERKKREQELEQYEKIIESAPDPIYALDGAGDITLVNEAFAEATDHAKSDLIGRNITSILDPEDVEASLAHIEALAEQSEDPGTVEIALPTPEEHRLYEVNITLADDGPGDDVPGTVGVARDMTELRERERQLRRTQRAIEATGHAIYITDSEGLIEYVNPAFEEITGYHRAEAIGQSPDILNSGKLPESHFAELWETIKAGDVWEEEVVNRRKDGSEYHASQTIAPITNDDSGLEGFVAIQTDITDHKDRLQQLRVMDRVLRHNLRNDMNVILGYAEMVREVGAEELSNYGEQIVQHSEYLINLTDKQRHITEVLSTEPHFTAVDTVTIIHGVVEAVSREYPHATIDLDLPESAMVSATDGLERAVKELVMNAIIHTDQELPDVGIGVTDDDETVQLRIADTGPGIPEMERRVVMGEHEIDPLYHGSGMGLWLVSWIIRRSDGELRFEENEPRGTVAVITLRKPAETDDESSPSGA